MLKRLGQPRYLNAKERVLLIKDIQSGAYLVRDARGKISIKKDKTLYSEKCDTPEVIKVLADVSTLGKGSYGIAYKVCTPKGYCENEEAEKVLKYSIKEIEFNNVATYNKSIHNPDRYENVEIRMLQLLSNFVISKATPHLNMPVMSWICEPSLRLKLKNTNSVKRYIVSELADYGDLHSFMAYNHKKWTDSPIVWKILIFQMLHTLATIHKYYPGFLHNDFKPDNILVRSTTPNLSHINMQLADIDNIDLDSYFEYRYEGQTYYIPDIGFQILLWDFDFSVIAGTIDNDKDMMMINEEEANITVHKNRYYDIGMFFGLLRVYFGEHLPDVISDWLSDFVLSKEIPTSSRDERILEGVEYTTPEVLLRGELFEEFKTEPRGNYKILDVFTGQIDPTKTFVFPGPKENRYTLPSVCKYGNFVYLVPKKLSSKERKRLAYRLKCKLSTSAEERISSLSEKQYRRLRDWIKNVLSDRRVRMSLTSSEIEEIINISIEDIKHFETKMHLSKSLIYPLVMSAVMYASYKVLLLYVDPLNNYKWWNSQIKLDGIEIGVLIDTFKQYCAFLNK